MIEKLIQQWHEAKAIEEASKSERAKVETRIINTLKINTGMPGSHRPSENLSIYSKLELSVDVEEIVRLIEKDSALITKANELFRKKYEVNAKAWAETDDETRAIFARAVTTRPARPYFKKRGTEK